MTPDNLVYAKEHCCGDSRRKQPACWPGTRETVSNSEPAVTLYNDYVPSRDRKARSYEDVSEFNRAFTQWSGITQGCLESSLEKCWIELPGRFKTIY